jgi:hypothetical protein
MKQKISQRTKEIITGVLFVFLSFLGDTEV